MKPWIETDKFVIDVDDHVMTTGKGDLQTNEIVSNVSALASELTKLIAQLNAAQWEIKAVLPILKGVARRETIVFEPKPVKPAPGMPVHPADAGSAIGLGWGVSVVDQLVVIVQRTLWVDDDDYADRLGGVLREEARVRIQRERVEIEKANARTAATIDKLTAEAKGVETAEITFREGGFLSKRGFRYAGTTYDTAGEAEAQRDKDLAVLQTQIADLKATLRPLPELP